VNKKFWLVLLVIALAMMGCSLPTLALDDPLFVTATATKVAVQPTSTQVPPRATATQPAPVLTETETPISWTQVQVALYAEGQQADGQLWELPLGTHNAVSTANGRYEAVESAPVGVVGNNDYGWCHANQIDCPPHGLLVRVEIPEQHTSCLLAEMDISWRIQLKNSCGTPVPVKISIRYNDVTRSAAELKADYIALAGLTQQALNVESEVGLFVSVRESGTSELSYEGKAVKFGYSCWDCLADTQGVDKPVPVPLVGENFSTFGPVTAPSGQSLLPGVVYPLPRPAATAFLLEFELEVVDASVVWVGRYDTPKNGQLPTPTATPAR
jgi:hypothetical protein